MKKYTILSLLLITCLLSCDKDESSRSFARVNTIGVGNIDTDGVNIKGELYDTDSKVIEDHGFIYNLKSNSVAIPNNSHIEGSFEKESLGSTSGDAIFESKLTRNLIADSTYLAKAYAVTNGTIVYGEPLEFVSKGGNGPAISSFTPDTIGYGDILTIKGNNFSIQPSNNTVVFDNVEAKIVSATDTSLQAIFPKGPRFKSCPFSVRVAQKSINSHNNPIIAAPRIDSISKQVVFARENITIYGENFTRTTALKVDDKTAEEFYYSEYQSDSILQFRVPERMPIDDHNITIKYLDDSITFPNMFKTILPTIDSFSPKEIWLDSVITIKGTNLRKLSYFGLPGNNAYNVTDTLAYCRITNVPESNKIRGYFDSHKIVTKDSIKWHQPTADSFNVSIAKASETVYLYGDNFFYGLDIYFDGIKASTNYIDKNTFEVYIPDVKAGTYHPTFKYNYSGNVIDTLPKAKASITIPQIKITNVTPLQVKRGSIITLNLENANISAHTNLEVDGKYCSIIEHTENTIKGRIPIDYCISKTPKVTLSIGGQEIEYHTPLQLSDPWECMSHSEYQHEYNYITHINDKQVAIIRNGPYDNDRSLYMHNGDNQWSYLSDVDFDGWIYNMHAYKDEIYFPAHLSYDDYLLYSYSNINKQWKTIDTIPIGIPEYSFLIGDRLYLGNTKKMCYRDLNKNEWVTKSAVPTSRYSINKKLIFKAGKKAYLGIYKYMTSGYGNNNEYNEFWSYDSENDSWENLGEMPVKIWEEATASVYTDKAYIVGRGYQDEKTFWEYDTSANTWQELVPPPGLYRKYTSFIINNEYFFGCNYYIQANEYPFVMSKIPIANMQKK